METKLLQSKVQNFINQSINSNIQNLSFKKSPFEDVSMAELIAQIQAKQKAREKLPTWYNTPNIIYPKKLSIEQTSSEECAHYKASLISGKSLVDMTGGLGVDTFYFAQRMDYVFHCEIQADLSQIAQHNLQQLLISNVTYINEESTAFLKSKKQFFDFLYLDPARRNQAKEKVFFLSDCTPNVVDNLDIYFQYSNQIMIKTSPLLDIKSGISELKFVKQIHIVALQNDVKELVWILQKDYVEEIELVAVNIISDAKDIFSVSHSEQASSQYSIPQQYLYEPNNAIMKTGKFDSVSNRFQLNKLHQHTQLYTSDNLISFPGRSFKIEQVIPFNKSTTKTHLQGQKGNVTVRNFPIKVDEIRKRWKIKEGGEQYFFFTTNLLNEKIILICSKTK